MARGSKIGAACERSSCKILKSKIRHSIGEAISELVIGLVCNLFASRIGQPVDSYIFGVSVRFRVLALSRSVTPYYKVSVLTFVNSC